MRRDTGRRAISGGENRTAVRKDSDSRGPASVRSLATFAAERGEDAIVRRVESGRRVPRQELPDIFRDLFPLVFLQEVGGVADRDRWLILGRWDNLAEELVSSGGDRVAVGKHDKRRLVPLLSALRVLIITGDASSVGAIGTKSGNFAAPAL